MGATSFGTATDEERAPSLSLGSRFFGRYEHALDLKGRVILPAKLRVHFSRPGYLTSHLEGCLALWTAEEFEREVEIRQAQSDADPVSRNVVREWASAVFEVEVDRQGRMPIPANLRSLAELEHEVLIIGMINRVELWSPLRWEEKDLGEARSSAIPAGN
ncbi:MAG TPA: division/cell wall cluster transcriptional repressor MraZ [Acidimicrobiales bacterium]|nr:division/cell wall cluster transcriptional repressor MraZ [Acidimicrobiales bacterium]